MHDVFRIFDRSGSVFAVLSTTQCDSIDRDTWHMHAASCRAAELRTFRFVSDQATGRKGGSKEGRKVAEEETETRGITLGEMR